jgi:hypothetical protein
MSPGASVDKVTASSFHSVDISMNYYECLGGTRHCSSRSRFSTPIAVRVSGVRFFFPRAASAMPAPVALAPGQTSPST